MFDGIYITKSYGTWFPFKCECEAHTILCVKNQCQPMIGMVFIK